MINVSYFITGHGLGHATRSVELIRGLLETQKFKVTVVLSGSLKENFFLQCLTDSQTSLFDSVGNKIFYCYASPLDSGAVQTDVFKVDAKLSLEKYADIHANREQLLASQVEKLISDKTDLVLVDATPLGCVAGKRAGCKVVLVTNFTWDFVYREMLQICISNNNLPEGNSLEFYEEMIEQCSKDTSEVDFFLRYPGQTPLPLGFEATHDVETKVFKGPLIARNPRNTALRSELNAQYNLSASDQILLLGFGGHSVEWNLSDACLPEGWHCFILGSKQSDILPSDRFHALSYEAYVPDYIYAADCVLGKIGYGFVSECISCGTVLVYVPRIDWPEEEYVTALLHQYNAGICMPYDHFSSANWADYLTQASERKNSWEVDASQNSKIAVSVVIDKLLEVMNDE